MSVQHRDIIALALLIDRCVGDPPNRLHPVAAMGRAIALAERLAPREPVAPAPPNVGVIAPGRDTPGRSNTEARAHGAQLLYGAGVVLGGSLAVFLVGSLAERTTKRLPTPLSWLAQAVLLKMVISLRGLTDAACQIGQALERSDVGEARRLVGWHLVSRDTSHLSSAHVAAATIESVAENASDGIVAPLFYYALGGLPAALAYRFISTCDSMLGYRDPAHEWLGKAAARLDDLVNLIPSRLTAGLIVLAAWLMGGDGRNAGRIWRRDARLTASPNAGHPMSAMAGALGVELEKVNHYRLGAGQRPPRAGDIGRAVRLIMVCTGLAAALLALVAWVFRRESSGGRR